MTNSLQFIQFFRQAAPYIHQHRGKTFVFCIQDDEDTQSVLKSLLHDIAILNSLGVRVVIVFGARHSLNTRLAEQRFHNGRRITDADSIRRIQEIIGALGVQIHAMLSMGLANSPMQGASIQTVSGNFIIAKPVGIRDGVDYGLTGEIRKVRTEALKNHVHNGDIALIPPLGYSSTGEIFNLTTEEVAGAVATSLGADKLLFFSNDTQLLSADMEGKAITADEAKQYPSQHTALQTLLAIAAETCQSGVKRVHLIPNQTDGAVLAELFTRDGLGIMVTDEAYQRIEQASIDDIASLLQLIRPLEKQGILVRRSRKLLEMEITCFSLMKRDNSVIGCAALYPYLDEHMGELSCVAVSPEYRRHGLADTLLTHIEQQARTQGITQLFCLTTHTSHWFMERGFEPATLDDLPAQKQAFYNYERNSKPYIKRLF